MEAAAYGFHWQVENKGCQGSGDQHGEGAWSPA